MKRTLLTRSILALIAFSGSGLHAQAPLAAAADAAPLPTIAYQGRLIEGVTPANGVRSFAFSILDGAGVEQWHSGTVTLTVNEGLYSVALGTTGMTAFPSTLLAKAGLKLRVTVSGTLLSPDVSITPAFQASSA